MEPPEAVELLEPLEPVRLPPPLEDAAVPPSPAGEPALDEPEPADPPLVVAVAVPEELDGASLPVVLPIAGGGGGGEGGGGGGGGGGRGEEVVSGSVGTVTVGGGGTGSGTLVVSGTDVVNSAGEAGSMASATLGTRTPTAAVAHAAPTRIHRSRRVI